MYNTINESTGSNLQFVAGINKQVFLKEINFGPIDKAGTGQHVLNFVFKDNSGRQIRHAEFPVDEAKLRQLAAGWAGSDPNKVVQDAYSDQAARMKHILSAFIPAEQIQITGNNYQEFCINYAKQFPQGYKDIPLNILLVYPKKLKAGQTNAFPEFPKKAFDPFMEKADPDGSTRLRINEKFHNITAPMGAGDANGAPVAATANAYVPTAPTAPPPTTPTIPATPTAQVVETPSAQIAPAADPIVETANVVKSPEQVASEINMESDKSRLVNQPADSPNGLSF